MATMQVQIMPNQLYNIWNREHLATYAVHAASGRDSLISYLGMGPLPENVPWLEAPNQPGPGSMEADERWTC